MRPGNQDKCVIELPCDLSIRGIADVYTEMNDALAGDGDFILVVPDAAMPDVSFIQLVEAARLKAEMAGGTLSLSKAADGALHAVLERGGFLTDMRPRDAKFWLHQE